MTPPLEFSRAVIVASGPSAADARPHLLTAATLGWPIIVINESWRLAPYADLLYACDYAWWRDRAPPRTAFAGRRLAGEALAGELLGIPTVQVMADCHQVLTQIPGIIGAGGNSGFQAVQIAVQAGARQIILVGFDYQAEHWHGPHGPGLNNPSGDQLTLWAGRLDAAAPRLAALGVQITDTSLTGALTAYPKLPLDHALKQPVA